ncbi:O-acetylserine/cysteine efflux transporter [Rhizobium subbaraonis]|uniref:O-acetylserine/cysteine efflux transporter n=1 Tax=Rhizobium subbaraonis TaxID=908946 RepID=A0A285U9S5_9HYPH|nr:EamA family transporter [Rhizobium subbaraonis]SOC38650.1 O-acetylserine/cysteine efflux transporter [Rhizobium subbaraonis]
MGLIDIALLVLVAAVWGFNFVVIKIGIENFPPILFSALRFLFAALPLVFFLPRPAVPLRLILGIGLILGVVKFSLLFIGMDIGISAGLASLLLQSQAFFTVILAASIYGERPRPVQIAGIVVALGGMAAIATTVDAGFTYTGLALVLAAGLSWAVSNILMKKVGKVDMLALMVWVSLVPPIPLAIISLLTEGWDRDMAALASLSWEGIGAVAYIAYATTVFGFGVWGYMIRKHGVSTVAPFSLLVPVFGMSSSALVLGESFGNARLAGAALVVCGLVLTALGPRIVDRMRRPVTA